MTRHDQVQEGSSPPAYRTIGFVVGWGLATLSLARAAPRIAGMGGMDSDEAITQLMANARWLNPFGFYFWGQDRLGAWPYLLEWLLHRLTGLGWSYRGLYAVLALCMLSAAWPLCRLAGWWGSSAGSAVLAFLVLDESTRRWLLSIGQPYAWQLSSLFWAWWLLRRQAEEDASDALRLRDFSSHRWWRFVAPAILTSLLSIWSSPLSAPFLWVAAIAEALRVVDSSQRRRVGMHLCGSVLVAVLLEQVIRLTQQKYASWRHWRIFFTEVRIDRGHILENLGACVQQVRGGSAWPVALGALLVAVCWVGVTVWKTHISERVRNDLLFAGACVTMGTLNILPLIFMSWGRVNDYSGRYLIPTWIFWAVADVALGASALESLPDRLFLPGRMVCTLLSGFALAACAFLMPPGEHSAQAEARARVAGELPERMPDGILFGCYWGTYSLIDGGHPHAMTPVVHHAATHRTPWTPARLKNATEVVVAHEQCPPVGPAEAPTPFVFDRGVLLHLKTRDWFRDGPFGFSLYENRSEWLQPGNVLRAGQPARLDADAPLPIDRAGTTPGEEAFTVKVDGTGAELLLFYSVRGSLTVQSPALRAEGLLPDGTVRPLSVTPHEHYSAVSLAGEPRPLLIRVVHTGPAERLLQLEAVALVPAGL
jgi:hypothetical protein